MVFIENNLDYDTYISLRKSVGWNVFSEVQTRNAIKNSFYDLVVKNENEVFGMARLIGDGIYFSIVDVVVSPQYQGNGIGKGMIEHLLKHIDEITPAGGRVSVQLISEKGKEPFYEKMGFKRNHMNSVDQV